MNEIIGFWGFGEVSYSIVSGLRSCGYQDKIYTFDINIKYTKANEVSNVTVCDSVIELCKQANLIFVALPGSIVLKAFRNAGINNLSSCIFFDLSTALPNEKKEICELVSTKNGLYCDIAVMGSVTKLLHKTPMILSGSVPFKIIDNLKRMRFDIRIIGTTPGYASTIKLCRSIFMKGLPALYLETKRVADKYGVSDEVFSSIYRNANNQTFEAFITRLVDGAYKHTQRQLEELKECEIIEKMVGIEPNMILSSITVFETIKEEANNGE